MMSHHLLGKFFCALNKENYRPSKMQVGSAVSPNSEKNRLRSTIVQSKLNHLTLRSVESDLLRKVDFTDLIKDLAAKKSRRCHF